MAFTLAERLAQFAVKTAAGRATPGSSLITALVECADKLVTDDKLRPKWEKLTKEKKAEKLVRFLLSFAAEVN